MVLLVLGGREGMRFACVKFGNDMTLHSFPVFAVWGFLVLGVGDGFSIISSAAVLAKNALAQTRIFVS